MKYNIACLSFDGEYQLEKFMVETVEEAWEKANDMGSRWFFYPFYFVVTESCKTIVDCPELLEIFKGKRLSSVSKIFEKVSVLPEAINNDCYDYTFLLLDNMVQ